MSRLERARRPRRPVARGLALIAATAFATGCGSQSTTPTAPKRFFGIALSTALTSADFKRMGEAGVGSLRFELAWPVAQSIPGTPFNWAPTDRIVAGAARQGIDLLPMLNGTPSFEAGSCANCTKRILLATHAQRAGWRRFVTAAVERYGPHGSFWRQHPGLRADPVRRWQVWNEQNNPAEGNPASVYAKLLALTSRAITSVDGKGQIVLGGMFGTPKGSGRAGVTAWSYLNLLYRDGAKRNFDAIALHPYSPTLAGIAYQIRKVRRVMKAHGDGGTPLLLTELGWGSSPRVQQAGTGSRGQAFVVGEKRQARDLTESFRLLASHRSTWKIGGVYWFTWKDPLNPPPGLCAFCYSSGLYHANGRTPKPALDAFERFTSGAS